MANPMANPNNTTLASSIWHNGKALFNVMKRKIQPTTYANRKFDLSNERMGVYTGKENASAPKAVLFNEFVECNANTVRMKKDFVNTPDSLLGDRKIPLSKISNFYGVENEKFKVGPLTDFNNNTIVTPVRNKNVLIDSISYHPEREGISETDEHRQSRLLYFKTKREYDNRFKKEHPESVSVFKNTNNSLIGRMWPDTKYVRGDSLAKYYPNSAKQLNDLSIKTFGNVTPAIEYFYKGKPVPGRDVGSIVGRGKFLLHSPETDNTTFYSLDNTKLRVQEMQKYLKENKVAQPVLVDNGRYRGYLYGNGLNAAGQFGLYQQGDFLRKKQALFYTKK